MLHPNAVNAVIITAMQKDIQKIEFMGGSFTFHKVTGAFKGHCSAWYDTSGKLLDAEQRLPSGDTRPVKRGGAIWKKLATLGNTHRALATGVLRVPIGRSPLG